MSSGENRAGCADCVGLPSGAVFCGRGRAAPSVSACHGKNCRVVRQRTRLQRVHNLARLVEVHHEIHDARRPTRAGVAPGVKCAPPAPPPLVDALKLSLAAGGPGTQAGIGRAIRAIRALTRNVVRCSLCQWACPCAAFSTPLSRLWFRKVKAACAGKSHDMAPANDGRCRGRRRGASAE